MQAVLLQRTIVRVDQLAQCILTFVLTDRLAECIINGQQLIDADAPAIAVVITLFAADSAPQLNARRWAGRKMRQLNGGCRARLTAGGTQPAYQALGQHAYQRVGEQEGLDPISRRRSMAPKALLVCSVESTRCPVSEA